MNSPSKDHDVAICAACREHASFSDEGSDCCGADAQSPDPDTDMER